MENLDRPKCVNLWCQYEDYCKCAHRYNEDLCILAAILNMTYEHNKENQITSFIVFLLTD